jgi:hypothetical protein
MNIVHLEQQIFALPTNEKMALLRRLLLSLKQAPESEINGLWGAESADQIKELIGAYNRLLEQEGLPLDELRAF